MRLADWTGRPADGTPGTPDDWPGVVPVGPDDLDTDGDGSPDTLVVPRTAGGAWIFTDLDADGYADQVLDLDPAPGGAHGVLDALVRFVTGG